MNDPAPGPVSKKEDARRSKRFPLVLRVDVTWRDANGQPVTESALAEDVSTFGGFLKMKQLPREGQFIRLSNPATGESQEARAISVRYSSRGERLGLAVELARPSETFWGVTFQLKRTSSELSRLEQELQTGGIDQRVLMEFRDAVDHIRKTAWVVYEWQERQFQHRDTATIFPLLTHERIRRATQLCKSIASDLESLEVTPGTSGIAEFLAAVNTVAAKLASVAAPPTSR